MTSITSSDSSSVHLTVHGITLSVGSSSILLSPVLTGASTLEPDDDHKIQLLHLRSPEDQALIEALLQKLAIADQAKEARNMEFQRDMAAKDLEISNLKRDMATKDLKLSELTRKLELFVDYVVPIRRGWLAGSRKVLINGAWQYFRGRPEEKHIRERNAAVHHGQFLIDQALFSMGRLSTTEEFEYRYGCPPTTKIANCKSIDMVDMRGTIVGCFSGTPQTHNKASDKEFHDLYNRCRNWWSFHLSDENFRSLTSKEKNDKFEADPRIEKYYQAMRQITKQTVRAHLAWLNRRVSPIPGSRS